MVAKTNPSRSFDAVIFDKDGTLIGVHETWGPALATTMSTIANGDRSLEAELDRLSGLDRATLRLKQDSVVLAGTGAELATALAGALPHMSHSELNHRLDVLMAAAALATAQPVRGAADLLASLSAQDISIGLATNDAEGAARSQLMELGGLHMFAAVHGYDSGAGGKPDPGMIIDCAASMGVPISRCLFVGDTETDRIAGDRAGMRTVIIREPFGAMNHPDGQLEHEPKPPVVKSTHLIEVSCLDQVAAALAHFDQLATS